MLDCHTATRAVRVILLLAALLCRHLVQRYAATSDEALHSYPATRFALIPPASRGRSLELAQKPGFAGTSLSRFVQSPVGVNRRLSGSRPADLADMH
jgi:hypothetical protein